MKLHYLGTAAAEAVPALFCKCEFCQYARKVGGKELRTRSGALLDGRIKIDFGPDSYYHAIRDHLNYADLQTLLITHSHADHLLPSDIHCRRPGFAVLPEDQPALQIYGNEAVVAKLNVIQHPRLVYHAVHAFEPFMAEGYTVTPLPAVHFVSRDPEKTSYLVRCEGLTYARDEEAVIYLIEKDGKSLLYGHDTGIFSENTLEYLKNRKLDLVSLDCTFAGKDSNFIGHMCAKQNLEMRRRMLENGAADSHTVFVANHFTHHSLLPYEEMQEKMPGFLISYDGMVVEF